MSYEYEKTKLDIESLENCYKKLTDENLKKIANVAIENITQIAIVLALPHFLMMRSVQEVKHLQYLLEGAIATKNELRPKTIESKKQLDEFIKVKFEENKRTHSEEGRKLLNKLRKANPRIENAIRILALNSLVNVWTIFESTSKEIWIYLLNSYQNRFLNNIITSNSDEEVEGITGKFISISLLGKYGYNLNNKLGNILSCKYDFTSCSGIKKAFVDLDKTQKNSFNFLNDNNLLELENLRNLIVHNAGIVDEAFLKRSAITNKKLGVKIAVTTLEYQKFETAALHSLVKLLELSEKIRTTNN
jgi:hypothetical protein